MITIERDDFEAEITVKTPHPDGGHMTHSTYLKLPELRKFISDCQAVESELRDYYKDQLNEEENE